MPSFKAGAGLFFFQGSHKVKAASEHRVKEQDGSLLRVNTEIPSELAAFSPLKVLKHRAIGAAMRINDVKIRIFWWRIFPVHN